MTSKKQRPTLKTMLRTGSLDETTNSASLADAERRIKVLEKENQELREEIVEVKAIYIQLTKESSHEKYDERRVSFLKAQMIQLERQILLLNEALGGRMAVLLEAENALQTIRECCRQYEQQHDRIGETYISKEDLKLIVCTAESAKMKLYKNIENTTMQRLHKPLKFMDNFLKPSNMGQTTILDVCSGDIEHLNLKQVAKLESQLSKIYTQLLRVNQCLAVQVFPETFHISKQSTSVGPQTPNANFLKLFGESSKACNMLNEALPELLELSVLVPAAPWPMLKKRLVKELTVDNVMAKLPAFSRSKATEVRKTVESLMKVISLLQLKATLQEKTYREEIKYHKTVYQLQLEYIDGLFKSLRDGYSEFEKDAAALICKPLSEVLRIYETLKITASEEALRQFLRLFKQYEPQISAAVAKLEVKENDPEAFSTFGEEFFEKLYTVEIQCQKERDKNIQELQDVKEQQEDYWKEIKRMFHNEVGEVEEGNTGRSVGQSGRNIGNMDKNESNSSRTEINTSRSSKSVPDVQSPYPDAEHSHHIETDDCTSARSERRGVASSGSHHSNNHVILPLVETQTQTKVRSSPLGRRPRPSSASRKNTEREHRLQNEEICTTQTESEDMFKASLRSDFDKKDFDFSMNAEKEDDRSDCTCGAEQSTEDNSVRKDSTRVLKEKKPPSGRRDSPLHTNTSGRSTRGIPKTRLVLKPRGKRDSSNPASDSETDISINVKNNMERYSKTDGRRSSDVSLDTKEAAFPYKPYEEMRRSGSLPRTSGRSKTSSASSPWK